MLVLNLGCAADHRFEGWFASADDFASQQQRGLVSCPVCGSHEVQRLPSAPRLNVSHLRGAVPAASGQPATTVAAAAAPDQQQAALRAVRQMLASSEDVGERFAEEARRIHYGEARERGIRGRASVADAQALADEGIAVMAVPEALKEPLQ